MLDLEKFYNVIRPKHKLTDENVRGFDTLIRQAQKRGVPLQELAYMLATVWLETAHTMQPIKEYGTDARFFKLYDKDGDRPQVAKMLGNTKSGDGALFPGRGYIQLTGRGNYAKASELVGVDLTLNPDRAMEPEIALQVMFHGMKNGWFTGKKFNDYIDNIDESDTEDYREYVQARRIINGTDKAELIATYALTMEAALKAAEYIPALGPEAPQKPVEPSTGDWWSDGIDDAEVKKIDSTATAGLLAAIFNILLSFFKGKK